MKGSSGWFNTHVQQSVTMRVSNLPVVARTGPNARTSQKRDWKSDEETKFVVGKSVVGGTDVVRGI